MSRAQRAGGRQGGREGEGERGAEGDEGAVARLAAAAAAAGESDGLHSKETNRFITKASKSVFHMKTNGGKN